MLPPPLLPRIGQVIATREAATLRLEHGQVKAPPRGDFFEISLTDADLGGPTSDTLSPAELALLIKRAPLEEKYRHLYRCYIIQFGFPLPDGPVLLVDAFQLLHAHILMAEALQTGAATAFIYWTSDEPGMRAVRLDPGNPDWMVGFGFDPIPTICARYTPQELRTHLTETTRAIKSALEKEGVAVDALLQALPPRAEFCSLALRTNFYLSTPPKPPLDEW